MTGPEQPGSPQLREPVPVTAADLEERVVACAEALAFALRDATDAGVGAARLLPRLVVVFKSAGLFSGSVADVIQMGQQLPGGGS